MPRRSPPLRQGLISPRVAGWSGVFLMIAGGVTGWTGWNSAPWRIAGACCILVGLMLYWMARNA